MDVLNSMSKSLEFRMELEEGLEDPKVEYFEPITIDFSSNSKVIEEEEARLTQRANNDQGGLLFLNTKDRHENFELEELKIPQFENGSSEEFIPETYIDPYDGKKYKRIDSIIFEYEEI